MSTVPPDRLKTDIAAPINNESPVARSSGPEHISETREPCSSQSNAGVDSKPTLDSTRSEATRSGEASQSDIEYLNKAIEELQKAVHSQTAPGRLARYAKFIDDPILKREGFIAAAVLPGEKLKDFESVLAEVFKDLQLEGEFEQRLGLVITSCLWRLNNLEVFDKAQRARAKYGKYFKSASKQGWRVAQTAILAHTIGDSLREMALDDGEQEIMEGQCNAMKTIEEALEQISAMNLPNVDVPKPGQMKLRLPADLPLRQIGVSPETIAELGDVQVDSDLAELGDLLTPERYNAELEMQQRLCACISRHLKLVMEIKGIKKKLGLVAASTPRTQLMIKSGKPPRWGGVRLVTTKRRR